MLIPIGTEYRTRHLPVANVVLIAVNVAAFVLTDLVGGQVGAGLKGYFQLDAARPQLHQYITYQFLHGDVLHLAFNMLFLWIFGNAVCDRMGALAYVIFYLAGGVFAGSAFAYGSENALVGASGSIAAVTTAFLALFPRVHVTMLVWIYFIFTFQVPAMILIVLKMIAWDNILAPSLASGAVSNVAYSAHLAGYAFGFAVAMGLLAIRALPRNQFDMVALWDRWRRRTGFAQAVGQPWTPPTARPIRVREVESRPIEEVPLTAVERLREQIALELAERNVSAAIAGYERLRAMDPEQVLARSQQIEIANYLAQARRYDDAVAAYEAFLRAYPGASDGAQVRLFLGLIYGRYLGRYADAVTHLRAALDGLQQDAQRALATDELRVAQARLLGRDAPDASA